MDQQWYQDFVADENVVFDLILAANFMGIQPLLDLTMLKMKVLLPGKTAEEVSGW